MKKSYIIALVAFLFISVPAKSQIEFGVKGGLNISNFSFDKKVFDKSNQTGFFIGPTVKFSLPVVGFDISALYDQRSADLSVYMTTPETLETLAKETIKQQQIVIPVNARFSFGLGETASIFFFAGPQFGFNLGDKSKKLFDEMAEWKLKTANFSINAGLGAMLLGHLQVSANYNIACGKTGEIELIEGIKDKANANVWQISLAYYF